MKDVHESLFNEKSLYLYKQLVAIAMQYVAMQAPSPSSEGIGSTGLNRPATMALWIDQQLWPCGSGSQWRTL
jgi:hypothetical protein